MPSRCTARLIALAIMSAVGVSDGCSVEANTASDRASRAVGCASHRRALSSMSHFSFFMVRGRRDGTGWGTGPITSTQLRTGVWCNLASSVSICGCRIRESVRSGAGGRAATATAVSSAQAVMMLSQRDCRPQYTADARAPDAGHPVELAADDLSGRAHDVPVAVVVVLTLPGGMSGAGVTDIGVQRPAVIGDDALAARG